jgi:outer membrane protein OmpA-like peptidoglycan-associated protein
MEANGSAYTVYFAWDSPVLTSEDIQVIQHVIADARASGQRHIIVVGHTDRSGAEDHNQSLSEHRADAVRDMMVSMGARREAIQASGVGEKDLAVNTPKGVKEPRNRRAVITLAP